MNQPSVLFQLAAGISRAHAAMVVGEQPRRLYAGNELIPVKSDEEYAALQREQDIARRLEWHGLGLRLFHSREQ